jgi:beta-N-acetylhexosaminidase
MSHHHFPLLSQRYGIRRISLFMLIAGILAGSLHAVSGQDDILASLSLRQRVAQMFMVHLYGSHLTEIGRDFLVDYQPGGLVLLSENIGSPQAITKLTNTYQQTIVEADGVPLFIAVDQESGPVSHLKEGFSSFPTPSLLTATGNEELAYQVGQAIGNELRAVGVNMNLAPVADLETNPNNPIIKRRSFGSDPAMVSPIIGRFIWGMQDTGILATAKHFPGHGESSIDSHVGLPIVELSRERLQTVELAPFRAAIDGQVAAIMIAHIWYPALEPQENTPASLSPNIVTGLLRQEMHYGGLIVTDALDMDAIDTAYDYSSAVIRAIRTGSDLLLSAHISLEAQKQAIEAVVGAVQGGEIPESRINDSVRRILDAKERFNVLDWQSLDPDTAESRIDLDTHAALIEQMFRQGISVVYDRRNFIPLPIGQRIALIYPATRPSIATECKSYREDIYWLGVSGSPTDDEIAGARERTQRVDVAVVFTQNADEDPQQVALVNALPPEKTVVVALWSVYDWLSFQTISAYMVLYSPLQPAISPACAILFGDIPAMGRLSITLPVNH